MPHKSTKLPWKTRALSVLCQQSGARHRAPFSPELHRIRGLQFFLLNQTRHGIKNVSGIPAHEPNATNYQDENHCQHHRILGDVLAFIIEPNLPKKRIHVPPPVRNSRTSDQEGWGTAERTGLDYRAKWLAFTPNALPDCASLVLTCQVISPTQTGGPRAEDRPGKPPKPLPAEPAKKSPWHKPFL